MKQYLTKKTMLVFGNLDVSEDSLAKIVSAKLKEELSEVDFIMCDKPDDILSHLSKDFFILDVVKGLNDVRLITDIDDFSQTKTVTAHDFDLSTFLKILKETGQIKDVKIIGVPQKMGLEEAKNKIKMILENDI
jgi:Ni,Fe-hydrogenase maturation factor